jgi:uncharacterized membrane protein YfcA
MNNALSFIGLFVAAMLGGALNAIAGGGSLISFPSLVAFGILTVPANATNTAALWPGSIGSVFGFWQEVTQQRRLLILLLVPSLVGGLLGALILVNTPEAVFSRIVPFLVLFATLLFAARDWFTRFGSQDSLGAEEHITLLGGLWGILFQVAIATYGGYFGAGQSIMMMASLSIMGLRDIHRINGLKTALAVCVNGIALAYFALRGIVVWHLVLIMGVGAILGGYVAARVSKRVNQRLLRTFVVLVGVIVSIWLFTKP